MLLLIIKKNQRPQGQMDVGNAELMRGLGKLGHPRGVQRPTANSEVVALDLHRRIVAGKFENRNSNDESNSNDANLKRKPFRHSDFEFDSSFGFWISGFISDALYRRYRSFIHLTPSKSTNARHARLRKPYLALPAYAGSATPGFPERCSRAFSPVSA